MFEVLKIKGFQRHAKLKIAFGKITTLVGQSDVGKSAVVRALKWVCLNQPRGSAFIKDGEESAAVQLSVDGQTVVRSKGKENIYKLNGEELKAFGSGCVPDSVSRILQVESENFQAQHESPFWLDMSGGELSKQLNAIADLDVIDSSLSHAKSSLRSSRSSLEASESRLRRTEEAVEESLWVDRADSQYRKIEELRESSRHAFKKVQRLADILRGVWTTTADVVDNQRFLEKSKEVGHVGSSAGKNQKKIDKLRRRISEAKAASKSANLEVPDIKELSRLADEIRSIDEKRKTLSKLVAYISNQKDAVIRWISKDIEELESKIEEGTGGLCPICGKELE